MSSSGFSKAEIAQLENAIAKSLHPIAELVQRHDQTLFGVDGKNGLNAEVREIQTLQGKITSKIVSITAAVVGAIGGLIFALDRIINHLGK